MNWWRVLFFVSITASMMAQEVKVTVVGAGLAGLTAAYRIEKLTGRPVDVYEARSRPGGRVYTVYLGDAYEELGGKFIGDGGEADHIKSLIAEMGLQIETCAWNRAASKYYYQGTVDWYYAPFLHAPEPEADYTAKNLGEVMDLLFAKDPLLHHLLELRNSGYEGNDSKDLSISYLESFNHYYAKTREIAQGKQPPFYLSESVKGGNSLLIERLAGALKKPIRYTSILKKITRENGKIRLHFDGGLCEDTEYLILAIPCSTLREVEIEKGLIPDDQKNAIALLQYGTNAKILLPVAGVSKDSGPFSKTERSTTWFNQDLSILTCYYGGSTGQFNCTCPHTLEAVIQAEMPALMAIYPSLEFPYPLTPEPLNEMLFYRYLSPIGISWELEEFSKGSYSSWGVGQFEFFDAKETHLSETVRRVFRPIADRIFIAGEHAALDFPATLEGAVESGERTARMVCRSLDCFFGM